MRSGLYPVLGVCGVLGARDEQGRQGSPLLCSTPGCQAGSELVQGVGRETSVSVSGLPLSFPMPLQCFPPLHIAKKWLEASSFCTVGCWPAP